MQPSPEPTNNKQKKSYIKYVVYAVIALLAIVVAWAIFNNGKDSTDQSATSNKAVVLITKKGFEPATLSVKSGTVVEWQNTDNSPHQVGANPYPTHSDLPDLNSKTILPGEKYTYTFTKAGEIKYYDGNALKSHGVIQIN